MKCIYCGYDIEEEDICPFCGRDLRTYKRIQVASALCYNEGLRKATVRDLSGAIDELEKALKYNKYNIDARNLLGLVYFEIGEPVNAMAEWVISKNLMSEDNLANEYLKELQSNPATLNRMDDATKDYNQAVNYVRHGDYDLAKIQLKRLVGKNPAMIRARSLLALIYMKDGEPKAARRELIAASKIDVGNPTINTYLKEVNERIKNSSRYSKRKKAEQSSGDGIVVEDSSKFTYMMDYSKVSIVNIIIGSILGILVSLFLIFPSIKQSNNNSTMSALIAANEDARNNQNDISVMEHTIEDLSKKLEEYEGKADVKESYENLVASVNAANAMDYETASNFYNTVTADVLDENGKQTYDMLTETLREYMLSASFEQAQQMMQEENYANAAAELQKVIEANEDYDDGNALFKLAECYENIGDTENALKAYSRVGSLHPGRQIGRKSLDKVKELNNGEEYIPDDTQGEDSEETTEETPQEALEDTTEE